VSHDRGQTAETSGVIDEALLADLKTYIVARRAASLVAEEALAFDSVSALKVSSEAFKYQRVSCDYCETSDLDEIQSFVDKTRNKETFSVFLDKLREEKRLSPSELYNRAGIDRRHWQKITENRAYRPTKETIIKFGLALELSIKNMDALLETAGFVLSASSTFDLVIRYCLEHEIYSHIVVDQCLDVICERVLYSA
jgi:hypothetical protein